MRVGQMVVGLLMLAGTAPAWADDADKAEIQLLKARLEKLERKMAQQEACVDRGPRSKV